jgi:hypothetical protein
MLFKLIHLEGIKNGNISLAFRKWKKPSVKNKSVIKTGMGLIEINDVNVVKINQITEEDASRAGFQKKDDLIKILNSVSEGDIYKISVRYHSEDPRIELRNQDNLTEEQLQLIKHKLDRFDRYSKEGTWTLDTLLSIKKFPHLRAEDLAAKMNREKFWLKTNIRKLKNLGLTISYHPGYTLSPLGEEFLKRNGKKLAR